MGEGTPAEQALKKDITTFGTAISFRFHVH